MTITKSLFDLSQLAEASYAEFDLFAPNRAKDALIDQEFSDKQATHFLSNWEPVNGAHRPNTDSGYSSTLFQNRSDNSYVLAFRGTEGWEDIAETDLGDIVGRGLAIGQIVDLYNEWQRLITPAGESYEAAKLVNVIGGGSAQDDLWNGGGLYSTIEFVDSGDLYADDRVTGLGLGDDIAAHGLTVTGHSLGGHLATAFTRLFPETGAEALTVNGAGYAIPGTSGFGDTNIANLFGMLGGESSFDADRITNVFGEEMPEVITMDQGWGLQQPGRHLPLFIEQPGAFGDTMGHGSSQMTDSLAVYDLLVQLDDTLRNGDPQASLSRLFPVFEAGANAAEHTLETITSALAGLFGGTSVAPDTEFADRESLYQAIRTYAP